MAKAMKTSAKLRERSQGGFSLLELMIAIVILAVVVAVIVSGVTQLQKSNTNQAVNVAPGGRARAPCDVERFRRLYTLGARFQRTTRKWMAL